MQEGVNRGTGIRVLLSLMPEDGSLTFRLLSGRREIRPEETEEGRKTKIFESSKIVTSIFM